METRDYGRPVIERNKRWEQTRDLERQVIGRDKRLGDKEFTETRD